MGVCGPVAKEEMVQGKVIKWVGTNLLPHYNTRGKGDRVGDSSPVASGKSE